MGPLLQGSYLIAPPKPNRLGLLSRPITIYMAQTYAEYLARLSEQASKAGFKLATTKHKFTIPTPLLTDFLKCVAAKKVKLSYAISEAIFLWLESSKAAANGSNNKPHKG